MVQCFLCATALSDSEVVSHKYAWVQNGYMFSPDVIYFCDACFPCVPWKQLAAENNVDLTVPASYLSTARGVCEMPLADFPKRSKYSRIEKE